VSQACDANNPQNLDEALEKIELEKRLNDINYKIIVLSGKGGVGKSTAAANLATSLALVGRDVGLLDIDFHGPSIPKLMGLENKKLEVQNDLLLPLGFGDNLKVMSLGFLLQSEDDAVIWRGPMKMGAIKQLIKDVNWGKLDYLIIDSPPGTGDEPLSIVQLIKNPTGAVIVTQPQDLSISDVRRSVSFCRKLDLPVLGIIENMSGFVCPHCGVTVDIFKAGGGEKLAENMQVPFLGKIPIDPDIVEASDNGKPFCYFYSKTETANNFEKIVNKFINTVERKMDSKKEEKISMSESNCRYAVPTANGELCMHFGHCDQFAIIDVDVEKCQIVNSELKTPPPHEPGILPKWLHEQNVNVVLAGGMGARAQSLFAENGIKVIVGASAGKPEDIILAHIKGELQTGENVCDH
jgi:ATP-binding protein involved in chromosome partitioning